MFTQVQEREVNTAHVLQSNAFTIKANGKAFKVLIDGLYANKVQAVIRELWSNAYDAHRIVGKADVPFDCRLPTQFEPTFTVRDYGVSMTHDEIMHLYTTVFESTKEGTNEQVGKLGLGSKSPFAYTDTFTVTAWKDGEKRVYSAFIGSDHVPMIACLLTTPSDEPDGIEVMFPVESSDCSEFRRNAERVAVGFDVKPNILGADLVLDEPDIAIEGAYWKMMRASSYYGTRNVAYARQGCVVYPIDPNAIKGLSPTQRSILNAHIVIDFPIGDLEISASRESLGYTVETQQNIVTRVQAIEAEIVSRFSDKIGASKTLWEATVAYNELIESGLSGEIRQVVANAMKWRGQGVSSRIRANLYKTKGLRGMEVSSNTMRHGARRSTNWNAKFEPCQSFSVCPNDAVFYVENTAESCTHAGIRIKAHWFATAWAAGKTVYWIKCDTSSTVWKRFLVMCGRPPADLIVNVNDLPKPARETVARSKVQMKQLGNGYGPAAWHSVTVDSDDEIIYVPLERQFIKDGSNFVDVTLLRRMVKQAQVLGMIDTDTKIYGVPKSLSKNIGENWTNFFDLMDVFMENNYQGWEDSVFQTATQIVALIDVPGVNLAKKFSDQYASLPEGPLKNLVRIVKRAETTSTKLNRYYGLRQFFGMRGKLLSTQANAKALKHVADCGERLSEQYPMISLIRSDINHANKQTILDYVTLIDNQ